MKIFCCGLASGGYSLIWAIRGRADGKGMVFRPCCPKQGVEFLIAAVLNRYGMV